MLQNKSNKNTDDLTKPDGMPEIDWHAYLAMIENKSYKDTDELMKPDGMPELTGTLILQCFNTNPAKIPMN